MDVLKREEFKEIVGYFIRGQQGNGTEILFEETLNTGNARKAKHSLDDSDFRRFDTYDKANAALEIFKQNLEGKPHLYKELDQNSLEIVPIQRTTEMVAVSAKDFIELYERSLIARDIGEKVEFNEAEREILDAAGIDLKQRLDIPFQIAVENWKTEHSGYTISRQPFDPDFSLPPASTDDSDDRRVDYRVIERQCRDLKTEEGHIWFTQSHESEAPALKTAEDIRATYEGEIRHELGPRYLHVLQALPKLKEQISDRLAQPFSLRTGHTYYGAKVRGSHAVPEMDKLATSLGEAGNLRAIMKKSVSENQDVDVREIRLNAHGVKIEPELMQLLVSYAAASEANNRRTDANEAKSELYNDILPEQSVADELFSLFASLKASEQGFWVVKTGADEQSYKHIDPEEHNTNLYRSVMNTGSEPDWSKGATIAFVSPQYLGKPLPPEVVQEAVVKGLLEKTEGKGLAASALREKLDIAGFLAKPEDFD